MLWSVQQRNFGLTAGSGKHLIINHHEMQWDVNFHIANIDQLEEFTKEEVSVICLDCIQFQCNKNV